MNNRVLKNASWIICCKIGQSILSFLIGIFTARYLGPSNYGLISYAASVVAFFVPIMQLGLTSTLVQEFISTPEREGEILGTALVMNIASSILSIIGVVAFSKITNPGDAETNIVCFLYSLRLIFQASEMTQYWFQAKLLSKYPSLAALAAYICVSAYKIYILITNKGIRWFAVTHVIEAAIIAVLLLILYKKLDTQKLSFSFALGKEMFSRSKYYISSAMMVVVFQQTDRIMLKLMMNEMEIGFYTAALTCVGISGFVFSAILDSGRPSILESKKISEQVFRERMTILTAIITGISLLQSIGMTVFAKLIVKILYGEAFLPTAAVLQIIVWFVTFSYYGNVRNIWILAEGRQKYLWKINLAGAVMNVIGNYFLIPVLGARGAALMSLLTQFFTNFVLCFVFKPMQPVGRIFMDSLDPRYLRKLAGKIKTKR